VFGQRLHAGLRVIATIVTLVLGAVVTKSTASTGADYLTFHYDNLRTGWYPHETRLTQASVSSGGFSIVATLAVDGNVYAQPLYVRGVHMASGTHNVLIVASEYDSVYAFDADSYALLWHTSFSNPSLGIGPASSGECNQIAPWIGVSSTPVIDAAAGVVYVVAKTQQGSRPNAIFANTLHGLSLETGLDITAPVLITGSVRGSDGKKLAFEQIQRNRTGLLLSRNRLYVGMGSNCDGSGGVVHGWVFAYSVPALTPAGVFNTATDVASTYLATLWQSTYGIAAAPDGSIFFATGNGAFDAYPTGNDYGDSVLRLTPALHVLDYFRPYNLAIEDDNDLGSGGVMLLPPRPGSLPDLALAAGKQGALYLLDRDHLGAFTPSGPDDVPAEIPFTGPGVFGGPAYFADATGASVYYALGDSPLVAYRLGTSPPTLTASSQTATTFPWGGTIPSVSSNGGRAGTAIVWAVVRSQNTGPSAPPLVLAAYDADDLSRTLFAGAFGAWQNAIGHAMLTPTIADGKVFVGGSASVTVFGLPAATRSRARPLRQGG